MLYTSTTKGHTMIVKVWTLTIKTWASGIDYNVCGSKQEALDVLRANAAEGVEVADVDLIEHVEAQGFEVVLDSEIVDVEIPYADEPGETAQVEVDFSDGTSARWGSVPAALAEKITLMIGEPDTVRF
jgi:hypothetical protein